MDEYLADMLAQQAECDCNGKPCYECGWYPSEILDAPVDYDADEISRNIRNWIIGKYLK